MKKNYLLSLFAFTMSQAQVINFPDANFAARLSQSSLSNSIAKDINDNPMVIDADNDGQITVAESQLVYHMNISAQEAGILKVADLSGIEYFTNLRSLDCSYNELTSLDLNTLGQLISLNCNNNNVATLNVSGISSLDYLSCQFNLLTSLNLAGNTALKQLICAKNNLVTLDLSELPLLEYIDCRYNVSITDLNIAGLSNISYLDCSGNHITSLDFQASASALKELICHHNDLNIIEIGTCDQLVRLDCSFNPIWSLEFYNQGPNLISNLNCSSTLITSIDISNLPNVHYLTGLSFQNCLDLEYANVKNGSPSGAEFGNNPSLIYICADEEEIPFIENLYSQYPELVQINSYCSFTPGGTYYRITGTNVFDSEANGCDASDVAIPGMKFSRSSPGGSGFVIADQNGLFDIPVSQGVHQIAPILEHPEFFTVSPTSVSVDFPAQSSPVNQQFCITPNGTHNDLEVTIMPVNAARPGFDAAYHLLFRNTGNTTLQAQMSLQFNDPVMDFVQSVPMPSNQSDGVLVWDNLPIAPFETRTVLLTMNLNSPMEIPALNDGDLLHFSASLTYAGTDETPVNNTDEFTQTVVNSYDPNDKTCLEGESITPQQAGDYLHYLIRFENTGTFPAENVVVKDIIDTTKFDISSLVPINSNYEFVTRITDTNKVEFIFENINLPFDDATNDGYILFKIKTKSDIALGSTLSNTASIYFDYNFPIVTNTAMTTVAFPLDATDINNSNGFKLYPNPAKNIINISSTTNAIVNAVSVYNMLGQEVMKVLPSVGDHSIDVSHLQTGSYIIKVVSEGTNWTSQFIKD
ncbi:DUF7619 domain-containing protein [Flavobacterium pallidum]|nr:T9SS type A sorting domain-containing protein [Flavobacterium pallidum]